MKRCLKQRQKKFLLNTCLTFNHVSRGKLHMVLLLSLLRVTTVVTLSVISYFHVPVVHLSFRLNKMMVNTNRKELLVRLLC